MRPQIDAAAKNSPAVHHFGIFRDLFGFHFDSATSNLPLLNFFEWTGQSPGAGMELHEPLHGSPLVLNVGGVPSE